MKPPRRLRPRRPPPEANADELTLADEVAAELARLGAVALVDADEARGERIALRVAAQGRDFVELAADAWGAPAPAPVLLGRLRAALTGAPGPGSCDADELLEALDAQGLDLLLVRVPEHAGAAAAALCLAQQRGPEGARVLVATCLWLPGLDARLQVVRPPAEPSAVAAPRAAEVLGALRALGAPVTRAGLARALARRSTASAEPAAAPLEDVVARLERGGLLVVDAEGGLSPASGFDGASAPAPAEVRALAAPGAAAVDLLAAVAGWLALGHPAEALAVLDEASPPLPQALPPARVLAVLARSADPLLERWRLEAAALWVSPEALASLPAPLSRDPDTLAAWGEVLFLRGNLGAVEGEALRTADDGSPRTLRLRRVRALALAHAGQSTAALQLLSVADPGPALADRAVLDAARAQVLAFSNREAEAVEVVAQHWSSHRALSGLARQRHVADLLVTMTFCERLDLARRYVAETTPEPLGPMPYLLAFVATHSGELEAADHWLQRCERTFDPLGAWAARAGALRARWAFARGELETLGARLDALERDALRLVDRPLFLLTQTYRVALARLSSGEDVSPRPWPLGEGEALRATGWHALFQGAPAAARSTRQQVWAQLLAGVQALDDGDAGRALGCFDDAIGRAGATGFVLDQVAARRLRVEACLLAGDAPGLAATCAALEGARAQSPAVAVELDLAAALSGPLELEALLRAAQAGERAPRVALAVQLALLGDGGASSPAEGAPAGQRARPLAALVRARLGPLVTCGAAGAPWTATWLLDVSTRALHRAGRPAVSFASTPLLWTLAERLLTRGPQSKEALVRAAWDVGEYHPLRDDNRLQVAVRKVRGLLEEDPAAPRYVLTTDDGYTLAPGLRVLCRFPTN